MYLPAPFGIRRGDRFVKVSHKLSFLRILFYPSQEADSLVSGCGCHLGLGLLTIGSIFSLGTIQGKIEQREE